MSVVPACVYVPHIHSWCPWSSEEQVDIRSPELELRLVVSLLSVLGSKPRSSVRALSALTLWVIISAPMTWNFWYSCLPLSSGSQVSAIVPSLCSNRDSIQGLCARKACTLPPGLCPQPLPHEVYHLDDIFVLLRISVSLDLSNFLYHFKVNCKA